jgi:hypothetical protein
MRVESLAFVISVDSRLGSLHVCQVRIPVVTRKPGPPLLSSGQHTAEARRMATRERSIPS